MSGRKRPRTEPGAGPDGVLLLDKPRGPTSHEVVARARRALGGAKVGHAGTLDPAATGLLVLCVGDAVKLQHWIADGDKGYEAVIALGASTETEDAEGAVVERGDPSAVGEAAVAAALAGFVGEIDQLPPMYSAVRVGGRRLHVAARAGEPVERTPRRVAVHSLALRSVGPVGPDGLREVRVDVHCGKGTYVRTLASDLGRALGVPAHLRALRRTSSGHFTVEGAIGLEELEALAAGGPEALAGRLLPLAEALPFPAVEVDAGGAQEMIHGRFLDAEGPEGLRRVVGPGGVLVAVAQVRRGRLRPVRVLSGPPPRAGTGHNH